MSKTTIKLAVIAALSGCATAFAPLASALDVSMSGFIRQEMAYKISNDENPNTRGGFKFQQPVLLDGPFVGGPPGIPCGAGAGLPVCVVDKSTDNDWNVFATKAELDFNIQINQNWTGFVKLRGYYQPDVFDEADSYYPGENNIDYGDDTDHFGVKNFSNGEATYLSYSNEDYMIDIPALYLDYQKGAFWMRIGQQQIAWGEALFFRVADVANGLDLRRHLFFDLGAEEYADERLASPGVRASYVLSDTWQIEAFAQMFQPSVLPTRGSPFNLIYQPFGQNYHEGFQKVKDNVNVGVRLQGTFGDLEVQAFAVSRHNPDPIFGLVPGGQSNGPFGAGPLGPTPPFTAGTAFGDQPFIYDQYNNGFGGTDGTTSPEMWYWAAGLAGVDGTATLDNLASITWVREAFELGFGLVPDANGDYVTSALEPGPNGITGYDLLDAFFALGGISGNLGVTYAAEDVFGFGLNYINYSTPDSFFDQLVMRFEASYTPDKKFTANDLGVNFIVEDEYVFSFVFEKYHRFSQSFPATFFILEWMHKSESDLLGRHLSGLGGTQYKSSTGGEEDGGWDGIVFAFQQPFPNLVWRADLSVLWDLNGGLFIQPAVRYKPSGSWTVEAFANLIDSKDNASIFATTDWSDDLTVRLTYQF
ncbi:MAG: DUF1302 family protein [Porticoccaceae bacterium]